MTTMRLPMSDDDIRCQQNRKLETNKLIGHCYESRRMTTMHLPMSDDDVRCQQNKTSKTNKLIGHCYGYVNVCAVVCLLLLVGGLSPRSSAAPYRSRAMDREKRSADGENSLWGNPCNYTKPNSKPVYTPTNAKKVLRQAKYTFQKVEKFKDEFASQLFSFSSFDALWTSSWTDDHFLRKEPWFREEVLPKEKVLYQKMSDDAMSQLMGKIDEVLPSMYKGLKMVVAGLHVFTESLKDTNISSDAILTSNFTETVTDVRSVLCNFYDLMVARNLRIEPLLDSDIPKITKANQLSKGFLIYRDTLNYLEYLGQVFQAMADTDLSKAA